MGLKKRLFHPRSKYRAIPVRVDGIRFDSKKEAGYYQRLKLRQEHGDVHYFLMQVPLYIPGGVRYKVDFLEFHKDGSVHYIDTKGHRTDTYKMKKKLVEHHYPIKIEEV